jgi:hypothetical protein
MTREQAREKAKYLIGMVQGTMALEGQGLDAKTIEEMIDAETEKIMNAPICAVCGNLILSDDGCSYCE